MPIRAMIRNKKRTPMTIRTMMVVMMVEVRENCRRASKVTHFEINSHYKSVKFIMHGTEVKN